MTSLTTPLHETNITMTNPTQPPTPSQEAREARAKEALAGIDYAMDWKNNSPSAVEFATGLAAARQFIIDSIEADKATEGLRAKLAEMEAVCAYGEAMHRNDRSQLTALQSWSERAREAIAALLGLGRKDTSNPKYDGYYKTAQDIIDSFPAEDAKEGRKH